MHKHNPNFSSGTFRHFIFLHAENLYDPHAAISERKLPAKKIADPIKYKMMPPRLSCATVIGSSCPA